MKPWCSNGKLFAVRVQGGVVLVHSNLNSNILPICSFGITLQKVEMS